jgi:ribosomal protein S10
MKQYFVTIWLRSEDKQNPNKIAEQVQRIARDVGVDIDDESKTTTSGARITVYGTASTARAANTNINTLVSAIDSEMGLKAKGKIIE